MNESRSCAECSVEFSGRKNSAVCSDECKKAFKRSYDVDRYASNRAATIQRSCEWQRINSDRKQAYDAQRRAGYTPEDKARINSATRRYALANPEAGRRRQHVRRATKIESGIYSFTSRDERRALTRSRNSCYYCNGAFTGLNPREWDYG